MHKRREEVEELFKARHAGPPQTAGIPSLVASVRRELHNKFLTADAGVTGANFLIADMGAVCTVTNEGNAELTTTPPRIRIVTAGIKEFAPSIEHAFVLIRVAGPPAEGATQFGPLSSLPAESSSRAASVSSS